MKPLLAATSLLIFFLLANAQDKLPDYGDISDLKGLSKVYVSADSSQTRKYVLDELKNYKTLEVVSTVESAEFVLKCAANVPVVVGSGPLTSHQEPFEMTVYTLKDGRQRIAWAETKTSLRPAPILLTRDFLKALKKIN
jgi:hypothetical protein